MPLTRSLGSVWSLSEPHLGLRRSGQRDREQWYNMGDRAETRQDTVRNRKSAQGFYLSFLFKSSKFLENTNSNLIQESPPPKDQSRQRDEGNENGETRPDRHCLKVDESLKSAKQLDRFKLNIEIDVIAILLLGVAVFTRFYKLEEPRHIVFDELHYGKYVSLYMKRTFFFDLHPPLGKQLVALAAYLAGFDGKYKFDKIGSAYSDSVPLFALRFVPALCGSLVIPTSYYLMLELGCKQWTSVLAAFLLLCDNALLTQSRFVLMESMLLFFSLLGFLCLLKFRKVHADPKSLQWWVTLCLASFIMTLALCVKYVGFFSCCLGVCLIWRDFYNLLPMKSLSDRTLFWHAVARCTIITLIPFVVYTSVFYVHLTILNRAGPHDTIMTSAFQASLEGGLASITRGQPLEVAHGSQITLRHTHGRACWLHSHPQVYPIRYPDNRGSSHQQQVTCYTFKDVNNWWIVKRPEQTNLVVSHPIDAIHHGDVIQLVHGMTSRALNSHDVSAPMSPHNQEVSCYIDYNVSMPAQNLWKVHIENREQVGNTWHTIESMVRLIHVNSSQALKFSGRHLPEWGFNQFEIVTDKVVQQDDTVWNVEEHRYTKSEDEKEREREMVNAEMIPLRPTILSFWSKLLELQYKMLFPSQDNVQNHMYSSEPLEWPLMTRGIAYWVSAHHNGQVHLLGNIIVWYVGTFSLVLYVVLFIIYMLRRRRKCYDLTPVEWNHFVTIGEVLFAGFLFHFIPYFFVDRTLFLHHYLPAFTFKVLLSAAVAEHLSNILRPLRFLRAAFNIVLILWVLGVVMVFRKYSVLSYGTTPLSAGDVVRLRWKESWDFIVHK